MHSRTQFGNRPAGPCRVLVADDDPDTVGSLELLLGALGYEVYAALDGERALELAVAVRPDVILLDLTMPGRDGCAVAREVRRTEWGRQCLLLAVTGWGRPEDHARTRDAGFDEHLLKPTDPEQMIALLGRRPIAGDPVWKLPTPDPARPWHRERAAWGP